MKARHLILFGIIIGVVVSCESKNESEIYSFSGKVQKGPFINGTNVTLNELNSSLGQTGTSFSTPISNDDGTFSMENIELNSNLVLLTANGYYFSEVYGKLSPAPLTLQAISDISGKESVNVNVLTHLLKGRIMNLVSNGYSYQEAKEQSESEMLSFIGVNEGFSVDFENLDISSDEESNAALLAFSVILPRYTRLLNEQPTITAELTQLLSNLASDFAPDGLINNPALIDTILYNISQLNLNDTRKNIEDKYATFNQPVTIPDFEKYVAKFQEKFSDNLYTIFTYPDSASPKPYIYPESKLSNILVPSDTVFQAGMAYALSAIIPLNSSLTIKFISNNDNYNYAVDAYTYGWELINDYPIGFTVKSQKQNDLMSMLMNLEASGTAVLKYYENNSETPTFIKNIRWD